MLANQSGFTQVLDSRAVIGQANPSRRLSEADGEWEMAGSFPTRNIVTCSSAQYLSPLVVSFLSWIGWTWLSTSCAVETGVPTTTSWTLCSLALTFHKSRWTSSTSSCTNTMEHSASRTAKEVKLTWLSSTSTRVKRHPCANVFAECPLLSERR